MRATYNGLHISPVGLAVVVAAFVVVVVHVLGDHFEAAGLIWGCIIVLQHTHIHIVSCCVVSHYAILHHAISTYQVKGLVHVFAFTSSVFY